MLKTHWFTFYSKYTCSFYEQNTCMCLSISTCVCIYIGTFLPPDGLEDPSELFFGTNFGNIFLGEKNNDQTIQTFVISLNFGDEDLYVQPSRSVSVRGPRRSRDSDMPGRELDDWDRPARWADEHAESTSTSTLGRRARGVAEEADGGPGRFNLSI